MHKIYLAGPMAGAELWVDSVPTVYRSRRSDLPTVYLIGSLRNKKIPDIAAQLREADFDVFDDWFAAGPEADDYWQRYEEAKGRSFAEAIKGYAAQHVLDFDRHHLKRCDAVVLVLPAGKSGHLELGYAAGIGKRTYVLYEEQPERWDVMYGFADGVHGDLVNLIEQMKQEV